MERNPIARIFGCIGAIVFAAPILLMGVALATSPLWGPMKTDSGEPAPASLVVAFALLPLSLGAGILYACLRLSGWIRLPSERRRETVEQRFAGRPWMWKDEWRKGRLREQRGEYALVVLGLIALFLMPPIGAIVLLIASRHVLRWRKFGSSVLEMSAVPAAPGETFRGVVLIDRLVRPDNGFVVTLSCVDQDYVADADRKGGRWIDRIVGQDERVINRNLLEHEPNRTGIPVSFRIPADAAPTDAEHRRRWELRARASVAGLDYEATFVVPIFRATPETREPLFDDETIDRAAAGEPVDAQPTGSSFVIGPCVSFKAGIAPAVLFFAFLGIGAFVLGMGEDWAVTSPWIRAAAGVVIGSLALLSLLQALRKWLGIVTLRAEGGRLETHSSLLGFSIRRTIACSDIEDVRAEMRGEHGKGPTYAVVVHSHGRKPRTIAEDYPMLHQAEALAAALSKSIRAAVPSPPAPPA